MGGGRGAAPAEAGAALFPFRACIACVYRASEWRHKAVELAAHDLLQHLDDVAAVKH